MDTIEQALFNVRFSDYGREEDAWPALEVLLPLLPTDERVRKVFLARIHDSQNEFLGGFERALLGALLDEPATARQAQYLLRCYAFMPHGEDGMGSVSARKFLESRSPDDLWLEREIVQCAGIDGLELPWEFREYEPKDVWYFNREALPERAKQFAKYLPVLLANGVLGSSSVEECVEALCKHPEFPLGNYDLGRIANEVACRLRPQPSQGALVALVKAMRQDRAADHRVGQAIRAAAGEAWTPEDFAFLQGIAADRDDPQQRDVRTLLAGTAEISPVAREWFAQELKANPGDEQLLESLALRASDKQTALDAVEALLANGHPLPALRGAVAALGRHTVPPEQGVSLLLRIHSACPLNWKNQALHWLKELYPEHPETLRLLSATNQPEPGWAEKAAAVLEESPDPTAQLVTALLRILNEHSPDSEAFRTATRYLESSPKERLVKALVGAMETPLDRFRYYAVKLLGQRFCDVPEAQRVLFQAVASDADGLVQMSALLSLAFHHPELPETRELLDQPSSNCLTQQLKDLVHRHFAGRWPTFEQLAGRSGSAADAPEWERHRYLTALPLWFGDHPEAFSTTLRSLRVLVCRWPGDERTVSTIQDALCGTEADEAARLLSRAFSRHPETAFFLREFMDYRPVFFGEYLGLNLGNEEALQWGLGILRQLKDVTAHVPLAQTGPKLLLRYFGPRKSLLDAMESLQHHSPNPALRQAISELFSLWFPSRQAQRESVLDHADPQVRVSLIRQLPLTELFLGKIQTLAASDPDVHARLAAIEVLSERDPHDPALRAAILRCLVGRWDVQFLIPAVKRLCQKDPNAAAWLVDLSRRETTGTEETIPGLKITVLVSQCCPETEVGAQHLLQRAHHPSDDTEYLMAIAGLCHPSLRRGEVPDMLLHSLQHPKMSESIAWEVLEAVLADIAKANRPGYLGDLIGEERYPLAVRTVACRFLGRFTEDADIAGEAKRVLMNTAEQTPLEPIRRIAHEVLRYYSHNAGREDREVHGFLKRFEARPV